MTVLSFLFFARIEIFIALLNNDFVHFKIKLNKLNTFHQEFLFAKIYLFHY